MANHHHSSASSPHTHTNRCLPFSNFGQNQTMFSEYVYCCPIEVSARRRVGYNLVLVLGIIYVTDFEWMRCLVQQSILPTNRHPKFIGRFYLLTSRLAIANFSIQREWVSIHFPHQSNDMMRENDWEKVSNEWLWLLGMWVRDFGPA